MQNLLYCQNLKFKICQSNQIEFFLLSPLLVTSNSKYFKARLILLTSFKIELNRYSKTKFYYI